MAITRTPIIDDDGTGTTGTVIDNAWKTEFYNQMDAAYGAGIRIGAASGTSTNPAGGENLDFQTVPVLTFGDVVAITVTAWSTAGTAPIVLDILPVINDVAKDPFLLTGTTGAGDLTPSATGIMRALLCPHPGDSGAYMEWLATGAITADVAQVRSGYTFAKLTVGSLMLPASVNRLYLRQVAGVSAGGKLWWSWAVHLLKG